MRLVIADDSAHMRWLVRSTLEPDFPEVIEVCDGRQLFSLLLRANWASRDGDSPGIVLVVDVRMPIYSGLEVLGAWQDQQQPLPIVLITSFPDAAVRLEAARLGAVLLPKPFSTVTLRRVVREARQRHPA